MRTFFILGWVGGGWEVEILPDSGENKKIEIRHLDLTLIQKKLS